MKETWRWFGPDDPVTLDMVVQAGASGIVTALHHIPVGAVWPKAEIAKRQAEIARLPDGGPSGLTWDVVESVFVSEAIKTRTGPWVEHIANYLETLENLAAAGIHTVAWNFMPVLDWTRTDLAYPRPGGATALRLDLVVLAAFDLCLLRRKGAEADWPEPLRTQAAAYADALDEAGARRLTETLVAGLPGAARGWSLEAFRDHLATYDGLSAATLRTNMIAFLAEVAPEAERLGIRLAAHPDDPPFPILGLPRVLSTGADYDALFDAVPSPANGICFCTGSLGARPDNGLPALVRRWGPRIHFAHLRNVRREAETVPCSFFEDAHLGGSTDMIAVLGALLEVEGDRAIPMRPDHGQAMLSDLRVETNPGYPAVGRLRGLAELRGALAALAA